MTTIPEQLDCSNLSRKQYNSITRSIEYFMSLPDDMVAFRGEASKCAGLIDTLSLLSLITPAELKVLKGWILDLYLENTERIRRNNQ